jgi:hypothetical protein
MALRAPSDIPEELLSHSLSDREIVLPYPEVIAVIHRLPEFSLRVLGWEGWLRYPDGQVGHSSVRQGTVDLSDLTPTKAADFCISGIKQAHAGAVLQPEPGELYFCITVDAA